MWLAWVLVQVQLLRIDHSLWLPVLLQLQHLSLSYF